MDDLFAKVCPVCKKTFSVTYPSLWTYKIGTTYYCRYNCWRVPQMKGESMKRSTITLEQKKKAVQIALEGGDPLTYLEGLGANSPTQTWFGIKKKLKASNPELFEKLPKRLERHDRKRAGRVTTFKGKEYELMEKPEPKTAGDAMAACAEAADAFFGQCKGMGLKVETPEGEYADVPHATAAVYVEKAEEPVPAEPVKMTFDEWLSTVGMLRQICVKLGVTL